MALTWLSNDLSLGSDTPPGPSGAGREAAERRLLHFQAPAFSTRTIVYVDGFNLYYGCLRGRPYRWLDLSALCRAHFLSHTVWMPRPIPAAGTMRSRPIHVQVVKTEEKGSDVNLATHLLMDAYESRFDVAVLVTNDSDLAEPVRVVCGRLKRSGPANSL